MSDYTNKEMLEAIYEVRDRVTRIEAQLNRAEKVEEKVDVAKDVADEALMIAKQNEKQIQNLQALNKWAWGFVITAMIGMLATFLGVGR